MDPPVEQIIEEILSEKSSKKSLEKRLIFYDFLNILCKTLEKGSFEQNPRGNLPFRFLREFVQKSISSRGFCCAFMIFCSGGLWGASGRLWG